MRGGGGTAEYPERCPSCLLWSDAGTPGGAVNTLTCSFDTDALTSQTHHSGILTNPFPAPPAFISKRRCAFLANQAAFFFFFLHRINFLTQLSLGNRAKQNLSGLRAPGAEPWFLSNELLWLDLGVVLCELETEPLAALRFACLQESDKCKQKLRKAANIFGGADGDPTDRRTDRQMNDKLQHPAEFWSVSSC